MRLVRALDLCHALPEGRPRHHSGATRSIRRTRTRIATSGAQARLADNGRAQEGLISAGETVRSLVINGLTLEVPTSAPQG